MEILNNSQKIISFENKIDFTLLDARATESDLEKLCDIAYKHSFYSVCVNSVNVSFVKGYINKTLNGAMKVVSMVGFPLGATTLSSKLFEAKEAISCGADEINFVINIGKVKQGKFDYVKNELKKIRALAKRKIVKVIIETCFLDKNEIVKLSKLCAQIKVDFIMTSTGFGTAGARSEDVELIYETTKGRCGIVVSGGIKTRAQAIEFINIGATRIATSFIL